MNAPLPTEQSYFLKCKIVIKDITYNDEQSTKTEQVTEKLVFLIPQESTQKDLFFAAWLPDTNEEKFELGMKAGRPVYGVFRGCIRRRFKDIKEPNIMIMSRGAEEDLKEMVLANKDASIDVEVMGECEDEMLDQAKVGSLPFQKKQYRDLKDHNIESAHN